MSGSYSSSSQAPDDTPLESGDFQQNLDIELSFPWREPPDRTLDDIAGLDALKEELRRAVVNPLGPRRDQYERFKIDVPNLLFAGEPGTGKTHSATALAGELGYPYVTITSGRLQSRYINESTDRVQTLFREAAHIGQKHGHAVIIAEELDTLVPARGGSDKHHEDNKVVTEFLAYLERCHANETLFIATTNRRDELDPAAVRAGRIDCEFEFDLPGRETRAAILRQQLAARPSQVSATDIERIAAELEITPATLTTLVEEGARTAVELGDCAIRSEHLATAIFALDLATG